MSSHYSCHSGRFLHFRAVLMNTGALRVADRCLYAWWHVSFVYSLLKVPLCAEAYARCIVYRSLLNFNLIFGTSSWLFWMVCLLNRLSPNIEIFFFHVVCLAILGLRRLWISLAGRLNCYLRPCRLIGGPLPPSVTQNCLYA